MKKDNTIFLAFVAVALLSFLAGVFVSGKVLVGYFDKEAARIETKHRSEIEAKDEEIAFWRGTIKSLSDGNQLEGVNLK